MFIPYNRAECRFDVVSAADPILLRACRSPRVIHGCSVAEQLELWQNKQNKHVKGDHNYSKTCNKTYNKT